jgi:hypothetical protein
LFQRADDKSTSVRTWCRGITVSMTSDLFRQ